MQYERVAYVSCYCWVVRKWIITIENCCVKVVESLSNIIFISMTVGTTYRKSVSSLIYNVRIRQRQCLSVCEFNIKRSYLLRIDFFLLFIVYYWIIHYVAHFNSIAHAVGFFVVRLSTKPFIISIEILLTFLYICVSEQNIGWTTTIDRPLRLFL